MCNDIKAAAIQGRGSIPALTPQPPPFRTYTRSQEEMRSLTLRFQRHSISSRNTTCTDAHSTAMDQGPIMPIGKQETDINFFDKEDI